MKNSKIRASLFIALAFAVFAMMGGLAQAATLNKSAVLTNVAGTVQVQRGGTGQWVAATENMKVYSGDMVRTQGQSSVVISWSGGNVVKLTSFTSFAIKDMSLNLANKSETSSFNVASGNVYAKAKKLSTPDSSFNVATPSAVAGVRGTVFGTGVQAGDSTFDCYQGEVVVEGAAGGEQTCTAGMSVDVPQGEPPLPPEPMTDEEKSKLQEEAPELQNPSLQILAPVGITETNIETLQISFITEAANTADINGSAVTLSGSGMGQFRLKLVEGVNDVNITITNAAGKTTTAALQIKYVKAGEVIAAGVQLKITEPANGVEVNVDKITIKGLASNATGVTVNGNTVTLDSTGAFSADVSLQEGENNIDIAASDDNDNSTTVTLQVFFTVGKPMCDASITLVSPADGDIVSANSVDFSASVPEGATVEVGGLMLTASGGSANGALNLFQEGANNFKATAKVKGEDCTEGAAEISFSVIRDTMPPNVTVQKPQQGFISNGDTVEIVLMASDVNDVQRLEINGMDVTGGLDDAGMYKDFRFPISRDVTALIIKATDTVGNIADMTISRGSLANISATATGVGSIRINVTPMILLAGDSAEVEVFIGSLEGDPAPAGIPVNLFVDKGYMDPPSIITDGFKGSYEPYRFRYFSPPQVIPSEADRAAGGVPATITVEALSRTVSTELRIVPSSGFPIILTAAEMNLDADGMSSTNIAASVNIGGQPAAGVPITFMVSTDQFGNPYGMFNASGSDAATVYTDENGVAIVTFIAGRQNGLANITATSSGSVPGYLPIVLNDAGFSTGGTASLQGRIVDANGVGISDVEVMAYLRSTTRVWNSFPAISGPDGSFKIINVPVGAIQVEAFGPAGYAATDLMVAQQDVVIPIPNLVMSSAVPSEQ